MAYSTKNSCTVPTPPCCEPRTLDEYAWSHSLRIADSEDCMDLDFVLRQASLERLEGGGTVPFEAFPYYFVRKVLYFCVYAPNSLGTIKRYVDHLHSTATFEKGSSADARFPGP